MFDPKVLMVTFLFERLLPDVGKKKASMTLDHVHRVSHVFFHIFLKVCLPFGHHFIYGE